MLTFLKNKVCLAITLLTTLLLVGTIGFRFVANYNWIDSLYMTVITVTTVGYGEVSPLDDTAKLFAVFLILTSLGVIAFSLSVLTEYIISKSNPKLIEYKKIQKMISALEDHVIICGYGRNGKQVAKKLSAHEKPFLIIENKKEIVDKYQSVNLPMLQGNAIDDAILKQAGVYKANCLITALPEDADNLFIVLSARQMNKNLKIISRASKASSYKKLKLAGADNVIMPDTIGGDHMASLVVVPDLIEFLDKISLVGKGSVNVEEVPSEKIISNGEIQSIRDLDIRSRTGCTIIGYKTPQGKYVVNPNADQVIEQGSRVVVLGNAKQIETLNGVYNISLNFD
ncbi:potassium channel family protein [Aquimarina agarivorans]|uniref:potassium channel family protein n=1 Tax=Aquimarina agarivorans TaxID=980584 RepID=UPI00058B9A73|nr:potassium channel protein [Aquimarina agarivorans]